MRRLAPALVLLLVPLRLGAQAAGKFPPDSLVNTLVIPHETQVIQVIGTMRNFAQALGVRCPYCHVGEEGKPLAEFDFPSDKKRTKLVARQMMRMVKEINARLDTLPERPQPTVEVTCRTCHRGISRPIQLPNVIVEAAKAGGADSGIRVYRDLRERYYGRDAYDFGESSLNIAAFRLGREDRIDDGLRILALNEELFPGSSGMYVFRGNLLLMRGDTSGAAAAFRAAVQRDSTNGEARGRLKDIGKEP
jgi:Photosynthetic reaction centre cytochrome C subunit